MEAVEAELKQIRESAFDFEIQFRKLLAEATLVSRKRAAQLLDCSLAKLDRLRKAGELAATYMDRRPRFQLAELTRYIAAHTPKTSRHD